MLMSYTASRFPRQTMWERLLFSLLSILITVTDCVSGIAMGPAAGEAPPGVIGIAHSGTNLFTVKRRGAGSLLISIFDTSEKGGMRTPMRTWEIRDFATSDSLHLLALEAEGDMLLGCTARGECL